MTRGPFLSQAEMSKLPKLPVSIKVNRENRTNTFNKGGRIKKYKPETLRHLRNGKTLRTDAFENDLMGIWLTIDRQPVPYAFQTADGKPRSMDAGCLVVLLCNSDPPELNAILDSEGYIVAVEPSVQLQECYKELGDARLHERVGVAMDGAHLPQGAIEKILNNNDEPLGFDPREGVDERRKLESLRTIRKGATQFRNEVMRNWGQRCILSGTGIDAVLEGAHIYRYGGGKTNDPRNGILLRADLHRLFDKFLLSFRYEDSELVFSVASRLKNSAYGRLDGHRISEDRLPAKRPHPKVVSYHYEKFSEEQNDT